MAADATAAGAAPAPAPARAGARASGAHAPVLRQQAIASLVRLVLNFRIITVLLTVLWLPYANGSLEYVTPALVAAALLTLYPLLTWERIGAVLMRHPSTLAVDLLMAFAILGVVGPESPFLYFTLGTALLAGILYGYVGAGVFGALLLVGYVIILALPSPSGAEVVTFQSLVGVPMLYPLTAAAGAAVRALLLRQQVVEHQLALRTEDAIVADERARLAREMHDSLAKTLHGIALSAAVLPDWVAREPERAAESARQLSSAAARAAAEARELIGDLRSDRLDVPLDAAVRRVVEEWAAATGISTDLAVTDVAPVAPEVRYELFCILKEALRNVERHADARTVRVELARPDGEVVLVVRDDGRGFAPSPPDALASAGHYGVVGMVERAARVGGRCRVDAAPGEGCRVTVAVAPDGHPAPPGTRRVTEGTP